MDRSEEVKAILQKACDRDWKDETLYQTAIIAANAIYWRDREIANLKAQLAPRPEEQALSLLRQLVNLTEHFDDAVWYDKDNVRHPAVTPLVHTLAAEVRQYLDERQPQGER